MWRGKLKEGIATPKFNPDEGKVKDEERESPDILFSSAVFFRGWGSGPTPRASFSLFYYTSPPPPT